MGSQASESLSANFEVLRPAKFKIDRKRNTVTFRKLLQETTAIFMKIAHLEGSE